MPCKVGYHAKWDTMLSGVLQVLDCCLSFVAGTVPTLATCNCPPPRATRTAQYATCNAARSGRPHRYDHVGSAAQRQSRCNRNCYNRRQRPVRSQRSGEIGLRWVVGRRLPPPCHAMLPCLAVQSEEWENGDAGGFVCYMADEVGARARPSRTAWYPARRGPLHMQHAACSGAERFSGSAVGGCDGLQQVS
jgi:hypothetical protein